MVAERGLPAAAWGRPTRAGRARRTRLGHSEDSCLSCTGEGRIPGAPAPPARILGCHSAPPPSRTALPWPAEAGGERWSLPAGARTHGLRKGSWTESGHLRGGVQGTPPRPRGRRLANPPSAAASSASASLPQRTPTQLSPGEVRQDGWEFGPAWATVTKPSV